MATEIGLSVFGFGRTRAQHIESQMTTAVPAWPRRSGRVRAVSHRPTRPVHIRPGGSIVLQTRSAAALPRRSPHSAKVCGNTAVVPDRAACSVRPWGIGIGYRWNRRRGARLREARRAGGLARLLATLLALALASHGAIAKDDDDDDAPAAPGSTTAEYLPRSQHHDCDHSRQYVGIRDRPWAAAAAAFAVVTRRSRRQRQRAADRRPRRSDLAVRRGVRQRDTAGQWVVDAVRGQWLAGRIPDRALSAKGRSFSDRNAAVDAVGTDHQWAARRHQPRQHPGVRLRARRGRDPRSCSPGCATPRSWSIPAWPRWIRRSSAMSAATINGRATGN